MEAVRNLARWYFAIGADPTDSDDVAFQKKLMLVIGGLFMPVVLFPWSFWMWSYDEVIAGWVIFGYASWALLSTIALAFTGWTRAHRWGISLILLLSTPALAPWLGNFVIFSAILSFMPVVFATFGSDQRETLGWFVAFVVMLVAGVYAHPLLPEAHNLPPEVRMESWAGDTLVSTVTILGAIVYFRRGKNAAIDALEAEQQRSDRLLLNVLPAEVAEVLKQDEGQRIARQFDSASVLFADIVGFTPLTDRMDPLEMVDLLNSVFSHFDTLEERYGVEKIRTIGDNYMVASGVPTERPDHAEALARMALDMIAYIDQLQDGEGGSLSFRIGINSGPMVGGVIGRKKFHYDVWGDTVNTASRMESHGQPGRIQVTRATRELLGDAFAFEYRGVIDVKGKGEMETWFLLGPSQASPGAMGGAPMP